MVTVIEKHKKMIQTVINQLPKYIQQYPTEDQILLNEFLTLLTYFGEAEYNRERLKKRFNDYTSGLLETSIYIQTPFLWFSRTFFQKANQTLGLTSFRGQSFYGYIAKQLRSWKTQIGVFELIRKITPLKDLAWEQQQYRSSQMSFPMSNEQSDAIKKMYELLEDNAIDSLNPKFVRSQLVNRFSAKLATTKELVGFLKLLESIWRLDYYTPAFGVRRLFYHIQTNEKQLEEIIQVNNPRNTLLNSSDFYKNREEPQDYFGIFTAPVQSVQSLENYLKNQEQKGILKIFKLSPIQNEYRSASLELYKIGSGWSPITSRHLQAVINEISEPENNKKHNIDWISPHYNQNWSYKKHQLPIEIIKLYCDLPRQYTLESLESKLNIENKNSVVSIKNRALLRQLHYNRVLNISWVPWQLVYEYSRQYYWLILPKLDIIRIIPLLKIIPIAMINLSKDNTFIWGYLTPKFVQELRNKTSWEIYPVIRSYSSQKPDFNWFNVETLEWITPSLLE